MVRNVIADDYYLNYITNLAKLGTCTVGLILGQPTPIKDYIIHFAKTPPCHGETDNSTSDKVSQKFSDILDVWVADHAKHATRMLPGGMYVLGIFVVSQENILTPFSPKIKTMFTQIQKRLGTNELLYGNSYTPEKLVLNYCIKTNSYTCKSYDMQSFTVKPAEIKFQPKLSVKWIQLECKYELDHFVSISEEHSSWPLRKHVQEILKTINDDFKSNIFMFDGEIKDEEDALEMVGKKRKGPRTNSSHRESGDAKPMQVTILSPCDGKGLDENIEVLNCEGQIKLAGYVASKIWMHPKTTVGEATQALVQDLIRSLAARLEMHWDSLIEEELGSDEDINSIHEPPRRVLVTLPVSKVTLSDYLFPGEGPQEAQISLQELLDIQIAEQDAIKDIEGQAELNDLYNEVAEAESEEILQKLPKAKNKFIYFVGLGIAFFVLIISIIIHFVKDYSCTLFNGA